MMTLDQIRPVGVSTLKGHSPAVARSKGGFITPPVDSGLLAGFSSAASLSLRNQVLFAGRLPEVVAPPAAIKDETMVEKRLGRRLEDPYRSLENLDDSVTLAWATLQQARTESFLRKADPIRKEVTAWNEEIRNYNREGLPSSYGDNIFYSRQEGLSPQPIYMVKEGGESATPRVLFDPNTLSTDGTVALQSIQYKPDGKLAAYMLSEAGSDMSSMKIRNVATGEDIPDVLTGLRFTSVSWDTDGKGFAYNMPVNAAGDPDPKGLRRSVFHHTLGEEQAKDTKVFDRPEIETGGFAPYRLEEDDDHLFVHASVGTSRKNGLYFKKDGDPGGFTEILAPQIAALSPFHREGNTLYARTDLKAPLSKIVAIDLTNPGSENWKTVVPESKTDKIDEAFVASGKMFVHWKVGGASALEIRSLDGKSIGSVPVSKASSLSVGQVRKNDKSFLLSFNSFLSPGTIYRYHVDKNELEFVRRSEIKRDLSDIAVVERLNAKSKDGTEIPMWVIRPKNLKQDGKAATILYGYGGFNIALEPEFSFEKMRWVEQGGVYVVANLRGGSEFGSAWADGGRLDKKQNVFDDFAACAKELIKQKYTTPKRLAIMGGSNGGLLTAATMQQNPNLFGAVISAVPVLDMARYQTHGIAKFWTSDYGDTLNNRKDLDVALKYSPLHNVKSAKAGAYPPVLITTADHDDRVAPWHAYKYAATLQEKGHNNTFLRVELRAGHGAGKPTAKQIQDMADRHAFLELVLGPVKSNKSA
jgi:prolyl oligopeptidase